MLVLDREQRCNNTFVGGKLLYSLVEYISLRSQLLEKQHQSSTFFFSSHSVTEVCSSLKNQFRDYQQSMRAL